MRSYNDLIQTIGNTPLLHLQPLMRKSAANLIVKLEGRNPGGSSKDRVAHAFMKRSQSDASAADKRTFIVATSGNFGVSMSMLASSYGDQCVCIVEDVVSDAKIALMRAYGARVIVVPSDLAEENPTSQFSVAQQLAMEIPDSRFIDYHNDPIVLDAHIETTAPEVWRQSEGRITAFVTSVSSGGTLCGVARYLKERDSSIQIVGVEPQGSSFAAAMRHDEMQIETFHSRLEGVGSARPSRLFDADIVDEIIQISDREAISATRRLAREQGFLVGGSSGLALAGAQRYAEKAQLGADEPVVVLFPDDGSRYLNTIFDENWIQTNRLLPHDWHEETLAALLGSDIRPELIFAYADEKVNEVVAKLAAAGVSQLPVLARDENLLGLVTEFRLLDYLLNSSTEGAASMTLADAKVIEMGVPTLSPDAPLEEVLQLFSKHKTAVILEDDHFRGTRRVSGILTQIDLLEYLSK